MIRRVIIPDSRTTRPKTLAEAKQIIADAMRFQKWDEDEQARYRDMLGVRDFKSKENVRVVIDDLDKSKMVLFQE